MRICFVEHIIQDFNYHKYDIVIAVSPMAMHALSLLDITYIRIDELFPKELDTQLSMDNFLQNQIDQFKKIDQQIQTLVKRNSDAKDEYCMLYAYSLKVPLDTVLYYSIIIKNSTTIYSIKRIDYHKNDDESPLWGKDFEFARNCLDIVISDLSVQYKYEFKLLKNKLKRIPKPKKRSLRIRLILKIRSFFAIYNSIQYLSTHHYISKFKDLANYKLKTKVLFLQNGYDLSIPYALLRHHNYIFRSVTDDSNIYRTKRLFSKKLHQKSMTEKPKKEWEELTTKLLKEESLYALNDRADIKIPALYKDVFRKFYTTILPKIIDYSVFWNDFYQKNKMDFVVSANIYSIKDLVALSIAKSHNIETLGWNHGNSIFINRMAVLGDFNFYTHYLIEGSIQKESYIKNYQESDLPKNITVVGSTRLSSLNNNSENLIERDKILYIPGIMWGHEELLDSNDLRYTAYYDHQKKLINQLQDFRQQEFVFKLHSRDSQVNPIKLYINERNINHIKVKYDHLKSHLDTAKLVIMDYPSTALFEVLQSNIPVIYIHDSKHAIDQKMLDILRSNIIVIDGLSNLSQKLIPFIGKPIQSSIKENQKCLRDLGIEDMDTREIIRNFYEVINKSPIESN
jgi:hypothetical protein